MLLLFMNVGILGAEQVLLVQSRDDYLLQVADNLARELSGSFDLVRFKKVRDTNEMAGIIPNIGPKAIVILEKHAKSGSLYWFKNYLQSHAPEFSTTAFLFVKDCFLDQSDIYMNNAAGITFLPPVILGVEKLQKQVQKDIRTVGIIHPREMRKMIIDNSESCVLKGVSLIMKSAPDRNSSLFLDAVTDALKIFKKQKVDALWIVEDESLLQLPLVRDVWEPFIAKSGIPTIVNNEAFLAAPWNIGTVCIVPEPQQVSSQIAKKIRELERDNWIVYHPSIDPLDSYRDYLKKRPVSGNSAAAIAGNHRRDDSATSSVALRRDSIPSRVASLAGAPADAPAQSSSMVSAARSDTPANAAPIVDSNRNAAARTLGFLLPKANQPTKAPPPSVNKGRSEVSIHPLPLGNIQKYILITTNHAAVRQLRDTTSSVIGWALKGQQFPVYDEIGDKLQIAFFNTFGWIDAGDAQTIEEMPVVPFEKVLLAARRYWVPIVVVAVLVLIAGILLGLFIIKTIASYSVKQTLQKKCILLARKGRHSGSGWALKGILTKIGFTVHMAAKLTRAKKWINRKQLDFIFIDWYLDSHIEEKLARLLRGTFCEKTVHIIFFDVSEKAITTARQVIKNAVFLGSDFTAQDIYRITAFQSLPGSPDNNDGAAGFLEGTIAKGSAAEILQSISIGKKSGCLRISVGKPFGAIYFQQGIITHASTVNLQGMDAVFEILNIEHGSFMFVADHVPRERNISAGSHKAIMNWLQEHEAEQAVVAG
jgi:hypothetical protein